MRELTDVATLFACADTLGALEVTVERVREYLIERPAFGRPLAGFQVLQHRLTDLDVLVAAADSLVLRAAAALAARAPYGHRLVRLMHEFLNPELKKLPQRFRKFRANRSMRDVEPSVNLWVRTFDNIEVDEDE